MNHCQPQVEALRQPDGKLPACAWPGGYPIVYLTVQQEVVCPACANDPEQELELLIGDVFWEGAPLECDFCQTPIASAYGDPTEEQVSS